MSGSRIAWRIEYEVGVPSIDDQHRHLFGLLADLTRQDQEVPLGQLTLALGHYIGTHFAHEEQLMHKHSYPRMAAHMAKHRDLEAQFLSLTDGAAGAEPQAVTRMRIVVYAWFTRHILGDEMDRDLGAWLKRIGVPQH